MEGRHFLRRFGLTVSWESGNAAAENSFFLLLLLKFALLTTFDFVFARQKRNEG